MMICGSCHIEKPDEEFTKLNISRDGTKGLCKQCKKERDKKHRTAKAEATASLPFFELKPDLLVRQNVRVGVLRLYKFTERQNKREISTDNMQNVGLNAILSELKEPYEWCDIRDINDYDFILITLTSVMDIENLIYTFERYAPDIVKPKIIVGGFGVCNIKLIIPYIDIACFGRGEGQINDIIAGLRFNNVWRKEDDPNVERKYQIRQTQYLVKGEVGVGCRNNCAFCHYTYVREQMNSNTVYNPGLLFPAVESDWNALTIARAGRYTSAWDGWSEESRRTVHKPVMNDTIIDKLIDVGNKDIDGGNNFKIYQIVGYPWETPKSVLRDIDAWKARFAYIDSKIKNNITLTFLNTPFGPEPMTPMQYEPANLDVSWQNVINFNEIYKGEHLRAFNIPSISGAFTLLKRVFIHRAQITDLELFKSIVYSSKLKYLSDADKVRWLFKHEIIDKRRFGRIDRAPFDYLVPPGRL